METSTDYQTTAVPYSSSIEGAVLGAILLDPSVLDALGLEPADFWLERNAKLFEVMRAIWDRGDVLDTVTVYDELHRQGADELVHPAYLSELLADVPTSLYAESHANRLKRYAQLRRYIRLAEGLVKNAYGSMEPDELFSWLHGELQAINLGRVKDDAILGWHESFTLYDGILLDREERAASGAPDIDWTWPWASWNRLIAQPEPGMLTTLAAGDGMGKTAYAENIAEHWAKRGHRVLFVHFELNRSLMLDRRAARNAGLTVRELRSGKLSAEQQRHLSEVSNAMMGWAGNITYLHTPGWSIEQVIGEAKKLHELGQCDAIVLDYLEKAEMSPAQRRRFRDDSFRREAHDVELLKNFAEANEVRVVQLSQLNKEGKRGGFKALSRTDVRGAGEKTEKSNIVILLHRESVENGEFDAAGNQVVEPGGYSREVKVRVNKQTMGETGDMRQYFKGETFQVFDYETP